jgi:hypothetical protein
MPFTHGGDPARFAYVIVAAFFWVLSRAPASALDRSAPHEAIPEGALATPAE